MCKKNVKVVYVVKQGTALLKCNNISRYKYQIFTCFTLVSYLQEHPLYKNKAAKFPTIVDSFYLVLTILGEFQHGGVVVVGKWWI